MTNTYIKGSLITVSGIFKDANSSAYDPTQSARVIVQKPDDSTAMYTYGNGSVVQRTATGYYYAQITATIVGEWVYRWIASGQVEAEGGFTVDRKNLDGWA